MSRGWINEKGSHTRGFSPPVVPSVPPPTHLTAVLFFFSINSLASSPRSDRRHPGNKSENNGTVFLMSTEVSENFGGALLRRCTRRRRQEKEGIAFARQMERQSSPLTYLPPRALSIRAVLRPAAKEERNLNFAVSYAFILPACFPLCPSTHEPLLRVVRVITRGTSRIPPRGLHLCRFCVWHIDLKSILLPSAMRMHTIPQFRVTHVRINLYDKPRAGADSPFFPPPLPLCIEKVDLSRTFTRPNE